MESLRVSTTRSLSSVFNRFAGIIRRTLLQGRDTLASVYPQNAYFFSGDSTDQSGESNTELMTVFKSQFSYLG